MPPVLMVPTFFGAIAAFHLLRAWLRWSAAKRTLKWREVNGLITQSELDVKEVRRRNRTRTAYRPLVSYTYSVFGVEYTGTRVWHGADEWRVSHDVVNDVLDRYHREKPCKVYVNPFKPEEAVLEQGQFEGARQDRNAGLAWIAFAVVYWLFFTFVNPIEG